MLSSFEIFAFLEVTFTMMYGWIYNFALFLHRTSFCYISTQYIDFRPSCLEPNVPEDINTRAL